MNPYGAGHRANAENSQQYRSARYNAAVHGLSAALGLSSVPHPIPHHILVIKAVALLRYQLSQIQKEDTKQSRASPWDHPKYQSSSNNKPGVNTSGHLHVAMHHDTRQFYGNHSRRNTVSVTADSNGKTMAMTNVDQFCPTIGGVMGSTTTMTRNVEDSSAPPIDWGSDSGFDTNEMDCKLKKETEQKLQIKSEHEGTSTLDSTNELSNEWDDDIDFAVFDHDIDLDLDLTANQMMFKSQFL